MVIMSLRPSDKRDTGAKLYWSERAKQLDQLGGCLLVAIANASPGVGYGTGSVARLG